VAEAQTETIKRSPAKPLIVAGVFVVSGLTFSLLLKNSLATFSLTLEGLLGFLQALIAFLAMASLAIILSLVSGWQFTAPVFLVVALLFGFSLAVLAVPWKLGVGAILLVGLLLLRPRARKTHEEYLTFSASHFRGALRSLFFILVFALAMLPFILSRQALARREALVDREALEPLANMVVGMFGGMLERQFGADVPEEMLAPAVAEMARQLLQQLGINAAMDKPPTSLAEVADWLAADLEQSLQQVVSPFEPYVPFVLAGLVALTLFSFYPIVVPLGVLIFFIIYRLLLLAQLLKLEDVPRAAKRLVLN